LHDDQVAEILQHWLTHDERVAAYRQRATSIQASTAKELRLLASGGKLPRQAAGIQHETRSEIRLPWFAGFLAANLLPEYYAPRNLLTRWLLMEQLASGTAGDPFQLLRRAANERINCLLQDLELAMRLLITPILMARPGGDWQSFLAQQKTDSPFLNKNLRQDLLTWAENKKIIAAPTPPDTAPIQPPASPPGPEPQEQPSTPTARPLKPELVSFLTEQEKNFRLTDNLWTRICAIYQRDTGIDPATDPPTLQTALEYVTLDELAGLSHRLQDEIFPQRPWAKLLVVPPDKRWPLYFERIKRLRNQAAHLRNLSFQDTEDLIADLRALREDLFKFAFSS
jgi:hypothetical protein